MIVSMTGYGAAQVEDNGVGYAMEIRSVNNRYLKLHVKLPEDLQFAEPEIDRLIRSSVSRGTVTCLFRRRTDADEVAKSLNMAALQRYVDLLASVRSSDGVAMTIDLATVAQFPGVADPGGSDETARQHKLDVLLKLTERGIVAMTAMRRDEGRALSS